MGTECRNRGGRGGEIVIAGGSDKKGDRSRPAVYLDREGTLRGRVCGRGNAAPYYTLPCSLPHTYNAYCTQLSGYLALLILQLFINSTSLYYSNTVVCAGACQRMR